MNTPGRPPGLPSSALEPFIADLSEGAETGVYLALLELIEEGLIITGDELILDANSAACRLLERDYRHLAGRSLATLFADEKTFLDARARLLIQAERHSQLCFKLPSGSGKTTLLRSINLLEQPESGTIRVGDVTIDAGRSLGPQKGLIRQLRQHVGFVFQNFNLFPHRTVLENIIEGPVIVKGEDKQESMARARELLAKVGLSGKENSYPRRLSGGQQQRVAIARALAMRPDVILFDEPTSALDPELVGEVLNTIRQLAQEKRTMVIVTHEMSFARDVADRAIFMDQGRIVEQGEAKALFASPQQPRTRQFLEKFLMQ